LSKVLSGLPAPTHIRAYTSTRLGGFSQPPFNAFNLANYVEDEVATVADNINLLVEDLDLPEVPRWLHQVHGTYAVPAEAIQNTPDADGSFTQARNIVCAVLTADCLPVLLCNRDGTEVAAVHAGWKGLLANVIEATISAMHSSPDDLIAWMGPALGPGHFALGETERANFLNANPDYTHALDYTAPRWHLNCYTLATLQLHNAGVGAVYGGDLCTYEDKERFYSFRRDKGRTGRMASLIVIT